MFEPFGDRLDLNNAIHRGWRWRTRRLTLHRPGRTPREPNKEQRPFEASGDRQTGNKISPSILDRR